MQTEEALTDQLYLPGTAMKRKIPTSPLRRSHANKKKSSPHRASLPAPANKRNPSMWKVISSSSFSSSSSSSSSSFESDDRSKKKKRKWRKLQKQHRHLIRQFEQQNQKIELLQKKKMAREQSGQQPTEGDVATHQPSTCESTSANNSIMIAPTRLIVDKICRKLKTKILQVVAP